MANQYILTIDQSTSGSKVMVVDSEGKIITRQSREHHQYYPRPGWVEHDPLEIYENILALIKEILNSKNISLNELKAVAVTNQRETILLWDRETGQPVYKAIVWQCNRTSDICEELRDEKIEKKIKSKTGLHLDPYFSATKLKWLLDNVKGAREKAEAGKLLAGTIDTWLLWKLTGGEVHATDYTNASRTLLFNINNICWDEELLDIFNIPGNLLPEVKPSSSIYGYTNIAGILQQEIPVAGVIGDSQGALFGQKCFKPGMVKATYGTGTSVLMNIGKKPILKDNLVTSIAWGVDDNIDYVFEGIIRSSGDTLKWVKDNLGIIKDFSEVGPLLNKLNDNEGVYLVPAFSGLGIPYWDTSARAAVVGMTKRTDRRHLVRAAVESIAYQITDAVNLMKKESGVVPDELRADGGATVNSFLMQFQADLLNTTVAVSPVEELSALGAAYLAGLRVGVWSSLDQLQELNTGLKVYQPGSASSRSAEYYQGWQDAVKRVLNSNDNEDW